MSTPTIAGIFIGLLILGGALLFEGGDTPAQETHTMPDGTMMDTGMESGTHVMPDGTVMNNTDTRMDTNITPIPTPDSMMIDHRMGEHTM